MLASRLPFLDAGYGQDPDAWRVAAAARQIAETGRYTASRLPGYPVQELVCALFVSGGPRALNGLTAAMSALAALFLWLSLRRLGCAHAWAGALAFAASPGVFVNSVNSMDYLWALAFALGALWAALSGRAAWAGLGLGLAVGTRLSSVLLAPSLLWLLGGGPRAWLRFGGAAAGVALLAYLPVLQVHGAGFLRFTEHRGPLDAELLWGAGQRLLGRIGWLGLGLAAALAAWERRRGAPPAIPRRPRLAPACGLAVALTVALFLRLPHEAEYLLPAVPFAIVALGCWLSPRAFAVACAALALSVVPLRLGLVPRAGAGDGAIALPLPGAERSLVLRTRDGALFRARHGRLARMETARAALRAAAGLTGETVIVAGWLQPFVEGVSAGAPLPPEVRFEYALDAPQLARLAERGVALYTLPGQDEFNQRLRGASPAAWGARPLLPRHSGEI